MISANVTYSVPVDLLLLMSIVCIVSSWQGGLEPAANDLIIAKGFNALRFPIAPGIKPLNSVKSSPIPLDINGIFPDGTLSI